MSETQVDRDQEFDPHQMTAASVREYYSELSARGCPVVHSEAHGGFYMLTSHPAVRAAAADWEVFSSDAGITLPRQAIKMPAIEYDPPEHTFWRNIMRDVLTVKAIRAAENSVWRDAAALIDAFADRGSAELIEELAAVIPGNTICNLIGITDPERVRRGCTLGLNLIESNFDPSLQQRAFGEFAGFCMEEIGARRAHPREDFISRLITDEMGGRRLDDQEAVAVLFGFFFAGHHTTTAGLASLFWAIASDASVRDALIADPSLIPAAAEEAVRLETPLHGFYRQTTTDVEVQGCPIPQGSNVMLNYAAANRDPHVFDRADEFVFDRADNEHLGFGYGIHACVGSRLARLEMRVVTEELLRRLPDLVATIDSPDYRWAAGVVSVIDRVPVRFTPTPALFTSAPAAATSAG